jgi:hypothetical protein
VEFFVNTKRFIIYALAIFSLNVNAENDVQVFINHENVDITTPGGRQQVLPAKSAVAASDVKLIDLTSDGEKDLLILRDRGATQEFYDVYLYSKNGDKFVYNKAISNIPCPGIDEKTHNIVGQCFHASACENWREYYSLSSSGKLSVVKKVGTYCDPSTGQGYKYTDVYKNGRRVSSHSDPVDDNSGE